MLLFVYAWGHIVPTPGSWDVYIFDALESSCLAASSPLTCATLRCKCFSDCTTCFRAVLSLFRVHRVSEF